MTYKYYISEWDTVLTDSDELMRYHYVNFFDTNDIFDVIETDGIDHKEYEVDRNAVVDSEECPELIGDIVRDFINTGLCLQVDVEEYSMNTKWYTSDEILTFISILGDNMDRCIEIVFHMPKVDNPLIARRKFTVYF